MILLCRPTQHLRPLLILWQHKSVHIAFQPVRTMAHMRVWDLYEDRHSLHTQMIITRHWLKKNTFLDTACPSTRGSTETLPLRASSKIVADTDVFIGTPSLLIHRKFQNIYSTCIKGDLGNEQKSKSKETNLNKAANTVFTAPKLERSSSSSWLSASTACERETHCN